MDKRRTAHQFVERQCLPERASDVLPNPAIHSFSLASPVDVQPIIIARDSTADITFWSGCPAAGSGRRIDGSTTARGWPLPTLRK